LSNAAKAAQRRPRDPGALFAMGVAAVGAGDREAGRNALLQSLEAAPPTLELMVAVADELAEASFNADAARVLRRAIEAFSARVEPKRFLAQLLVDVGDDAQALQTAERALNEHPGNVHLHMLAATALERLAQPERAAHHLSAASAADPDNLEIQRRLAAILRDSGDARGAVACLRRIVTASRRHDLEAMTALGIALSSNEEHAEAIQILSEVARARPDVDTVHGDLAMALFGAGRVNDAIDGFLAALALNPQSAQAYCGLGLAYQSLEQWPQAADAFAATARLAPDQALGHFNLGLALSALGKWDEARAALTRAAALDPADEEARAALASLPAVPADETAAPAATPFSGNLATFGLAEVLEFLRLQSKTGSLVLSSRHGAGIIRLVQGKVTSASAPGAKRLGESLVETGVISRAELAAALAKQRSEGGDSPESLGEMLLRDRPQDRALLTRAVHAQILWAMAQLLGWPEGGFSLHPSTDTRLPAISFDLQNLMMELLSRPDE
jgi:tetratricopeptide (TPR) repeat protein